MFGTWCVREGSSGKFRGESGKFLGKGKGGSVGIVGGGGKMGKGKGKENGSRCVVSGENNAKYMRHVNR